MQLPTTQSVPEWSWPAVPLFPPSGYIQSHMVYVTPPGLLRTAVLLLVPPNLLPDGLGLKAEGSLATTEQQLEHQCVCYQHCSLSKSNHSTAPAMEEI